MITLPHPPIHYILYWFSIVVVLDSLSNQLYNNKYLSWDSLVTKEFVDDWLIDWGVGEETFLFKIIPNILNLKRTMFSRRMLLSL